MYAANLADRSLHKSLKSRLESKLLLTIINIPAIVGILCSSLNHRCITPY